MFVLVLNDMRMPNIEMSKPVARASTREALEALLQRESVPSYRDGQWGKCFRQSGPLEWFNPPCDVFGQGIVNTGTLQERIDRAIAEVNDWWNHTVMPIPEV